jgi:hypothetical protein
MAEPVGIDTVVNGTRYKLKQCEVLRVEDEFGHSYMIDGQPVCGVTTLLGLGMPIEAGLLEYFKRNDKDTQEDILIDAQERGSNVHHAIERLLLGESVPSDSFYRKREKLGVAAFVDFFIRIKPTDTVTEQVIAYVDEHMKFAGTLDLICTINGMRILIDFKTSTVHSRKNELQVIAYKESVEQSTGERIDACYLLYLGTTHKGKQPKTDRNGLPTSGVGWFMVEATGTFDDFKRAYDTALFMNHGKYPTPPRVAVYPDTWKILERKQEEK